MRYTLAVGGRLTGNPDTEEMSRESSLILTCTKVILRDLEWMKWTEDEENLEHKD